MNVLGLGQGGPQRDKVASVGEGGVGVHGDQVCRDPEAEEQRTLAPSPGMEAGGVGSRASTHLGAAVHEEDGGVLLPRLHGVRLVDHAVQAHVRPRVEVEDFRGHVIWGTACRDRAAAATQVGAHGR